LRGVFVNDEDETTTKMKASKSHALSVISCTCQVAITIVACRNLPRNDFFTRKADPFCRVGLFYFSVNTFWFRVVF